MSDKRAAKVARRTKRKAKQRLRAGQQRSLLVREVATPTGPEVRVYEERPTDWEHLGVVAARPPDAPGKRRVVCSRCRWEGQRYAEYYVHPDRAPDGSRRKRGDLSLRKAVPTNPLRKPCPRCGGAVTEP